MTQTSRLEFDLDVPAFVFTCTLGERTIFTCDVQSAITIVGVFDEACDERLLHFEATRTTCAPDGAEYVEQYGAGPVTDCLFPGLEIDGL